ncbi:putative O-glycosylation ligase, exosortase A system-associated [Zoogloea sp.]|uniref:putative O-glycosylation ligase, exosortase A system-associated n=1 Tax=Zoogloea sp. TaxID=49181 RepID=UPI0035B1A17B
MRDLLVLSVFLFGALKALKSPYNGALLWVWIGLMNPHRLGWGFAYTMPLALTAALLTVVAMATHPKQVQSPASGPVTVLTIFVIWMAVTTYTAIHYADSLVAYNEVLKVLVMVLVVASVVRTREQILGLVATASMSIAYFGAKGGLFTLMTGGSFRVWGPPASVVEGNNELAVALVITIPLLNFMALQVDKVMEFPLLRPIGKRWVTRILYLIMALCAVAAIGSHSRGALLAIGAMFGMLWWRSKSKLTIGLLLLLLAPAMLFFMPEEWTSRMGTIKTYDQDESALGRINAWIMAINIANNRILGAGFLTNSPLVYQMYAPNSNFILVAHSIYFQVLGQHGYIGLFLYLLFWGLTYRTAGRLEKAGKLAPDFEWVGQLGSMIKVSLIGFAVGGAFLSLAYWDMPYYFMALVVASEKWVKRTLAERAANPALQPDGNAGAPGGVQTLRASS